MNAKNMAGPMLATAVCALTLSLTTTPARAGDFRIVPGVRVGSVALGQTEADVIKALNKPTRTRKISRELVALTWIGKEPLSKAAFEDKNLKSDYLTVFFVRGRVAQIEVTSPRFMAAGRGRVAGRLSTASATWYRAFPPTRRVNHTWRATDPAASSLAGKHLLHDDDDVPAGLACKYGVWADTAPDPPTDHGTPEAVIVHRRGADVLLNPDDADDYAGTGHRKDPPEARS